MCIRDSIKTMGQTLQRGSKSVKGGQSTKRMNATEVSDIGAGGALQKKRVAKLNMLKEI